MAQPTPGDVHVDAALTDMSIAYIQDQAQYVAAKVFPAKPVEKQTDKYHIFTKNDFFRDDAVKKRAPNSAAPRSGFGLSTGTYDCTSWWTAVAIDEQLRANADPAVPLDQAGMRLITQRMLIRRDRLFATAFMNTDSVWGTDVTGTTDFTKWDDASSDPENDVATGKETVLKNTGFEPNKLVVSHAVHRALKRHPLIKDRFKYTSSESITVGMLAAFFEVDEYEIAKSVYATNNEGGTAAMDFAVGKHALLVHSNGDASIMTPVSGTIFVWRGLTGLNDAGVRIDQYYDPDKKCDVIRGEFAFDMKVTGSDLGYRFKTAVS